MLTRRHMLTGSTAALLLAACRGDTDARTALTDKVTHARRPGQPAVGIQTYTIRSAMEEDTAAALTMLKEVGYDFIETNERDFTRLPMDELLAIIRDIDLPVPATHIGYDTMMQTPEKAAEMTAALGATYSILPWTPEEMRTAAGYAELAGKFSSIGEMMTGEGLRFAYHNHQFEFWNIDGARTGMDILLEDTDPAHVWFELDLFWTALGRQDVAELFRAHPGRFKLCHIKDMKTAGLSEYPADSLDFESIGRDLMTDVGNGDLPFEEWLGMENVSGIEYLITEHDNPPAPIRDSVAKSLETVRAYSL